LFSFPSFYLFVVVVAVVIVVAATAATAAAAALVGSAEKSISRAVSVEWNFQPSNSTGFISFSLLGFIQRRTNIDKLFGKRFGRNSIRVRLKRVIHIELKLLRLNPRRSR